jgi:hypothetical protein
VPPPPLPAHAIFSSTALRKPASNTELDLQINKSELLQNFYLETRRTPMARVIFEQYKSSDLTIGLPAMQRLCYDFGVCMSATDMEDAVRKYASLPGGTMVYEDFTAWWAENEAIRYVKRILVCIDSGAFSKSTYVWWCVTFVQRRQAERPRVHPKESSGHVFQEVRPRAARLHPRGLLSLRFRHVASA